MRQFLTDALGSTLALLDPAGAIQTQYSYEPFGRTTVAGAFDSDSFRYTGRETDETGLNYNRARYYHPVLEILLLRTKLILQEVIRTCMRMSAAAQPTKRTLQVWRKRSSLRCQ